MEFKMVQVFKLILICVSFFAFTDLSYAENNTLKSASPILAEAKISSGETVTLKSDDLEVIAIKTATKEGWKINFSGTSKGKRIFSFNYAFKNAVDYESTVKIVKLSQDSAYPQILFDAYTGGAHCCTMTEILFASKSGNWQITDFGYRDQELLTFEDITGTGNYVVIGVDESFNYTFDCYACSRPPIKIEEFKNGQLKDVTREPRFRERLKMELQTIEADPSNDWNSNGFLAGWTALKSLLGEQNDAFRRLLPLYDKTSDFGVMECTVAASIANCPAGKLKHLPLPEGLKKHLVLKNYLTSNQVAGLPRTDKDVPKKDIPEDHPTGQKPFILNEITPEPTMSPDGPIGSLTKREICQYAVINTLFGTVPAQWDNRPAYRDYLNEAKTRGYSIENCSQALGQ